MPFDFSAVSAPFRMQPGLRRLAPGALQLTPNRIGDRSLLEKLAVLRHDPQRALLSAPGFDPAPALNGLSMHAALEHPQAFGWREDGRCSAPHLRWSIQGSEVLGDGPPEFGECLRALPVVWRRPALLALAFAEDFAVVDAASGCIEWLAVCLPSRWAPEEKVGRLFTEVHAPVADNQLLISASVQLMKLVTGAERWERFVWTLTPAGRLDQHPVRQAHETWPAQADAAMLAATAFFRTERQTFIPLPERQQAVFTIHVETRPLIEIARSAPAAQQLHDAIASMSAAVIAYRSLGDARERLLAWLSARAAGA